MDNIMKKIALNYLVIAALICSAALTSCTDKGSGDVKLLESIIYDNGEITKFEYDDKNRIVKISYGSQRTETLTYSGDELISFEDDYNGLTPISRNGNTIRIPGENTSVITVNDDGYSIKHEIDANEHGSEVRTYQYRDGNPVKITVVQTDWEGMTSETVMEFKHDDKKSPFFHCNTPRWFLQYIYFTYFGLNNNVTAVTWSHGISHKYEYQYDRDGFPTTQTSITKSANGDKTKTITRFTYRGETENRLLATETGRAPDFDIYGRWNYVMTPSDPDEHREMAITVKTDNTVAIQFYAGYYTGVISQTDRHFRVHSLTGSYPDMDEFKLDEEWTLTYNPETELLSLGRQNEKTFHYRRGTDDGELTSDHAVTDYSGELSFNKITYDSNF